MILCQVISKAGNKRLLYGDTTAQNNIYSIQSRTQCKCVVTCIQNTKVCVTPVLHQVLKIWPQQTCQQHERNAKYELITILLQSARPTDSQFQRIISFDIIANSVFTIVFFFDGLAQSGNRCYKVQRGCQKIQFNNCLYGFLLRYVGMSKMGSLAAILQIIMFIAFLTLTQYGFGYACSITRG